MKIVKVERAGQVADGLLEGEDIHIVGAWHHGPADLAPFALSRRLGEDMSALRAEAHETIARSSVTLAVPIDPLAKILCIGMNYRDHVGEIKQEVAANPNVFTRTLDTFVADGESIVRPQISETFDYEGEIAIVIGRLARHVSPDEAMACVGGYSILMDGSVREYQRHSVTAGKNFFRSGAMGPWIVPTGELGVEDPAVQTRLNGQVVQSARASEMIFGIREIVAYCSRWTPLRPGDVIATGTPGGVGSRRQPPLWMKPGDRIEVEVEGIGVLGNGVVDEA